MQRRFSRVASYRGALLGLTVLGGAACAGTPLPEPPDELPAPDFDDFARDSITTVGFPDRPSVLIGAAQPGTVQPRSRVWFINLDTDDAPIEISADAQGGFVVPPIPALPGERIRVISRTGQQHSAPLDLEVIPAEVAGAPLQPARLSATALSCLRVTPAPTLLLRGSQGALRLENRCESTVTLTRVALRFGDQGLMLSTPPAALAAGEDVSLTLRDVQGPGAVERLDIVLIDAQADDGRAGRLAIDVFSALE
jgi:hypothetical protein